MHGKARAFLVAVLGRPGATALQTLAKSDPALAGYLVPRAALAWLSHVSTTAGMPGCPDIELTLRKTNDRFAGAVELEGDSHFLKASPATHVAAVVSFALGVEPEIAPTLRDRDLASLGHTIDLLAKAQAKRPDAAGTGSVASAIAPTAPAQPTSTAPDTTQRKRIQIPMKPKKPEGAPKPKTAPLALAEADMGRICRACGIGQFEKGKFRGCYCIRSMVKSIATTRRPDGRWDIHLERLAPDEAALVIELFKGPNDGR